MQIHYLATGSTGNAYVVADGDHSVLLDAGIPAREIIKRLGKLGLSLPSVCLITHEHGDHAKAAHDLKKLGVEIYASLGTSNAIGFEPCIYYALEHKSTIHNIGNTNFILTPLKAVHDAVDPMMFIIASRASKQSLLYATDTSEIPYRINGLTHLLIEANFDWDAMELNQKNIRTAKNHMSLQGLIEFLNRTPLDTLQEIHLCHCSQENIDEQRAVDTIQRLTGIPTYSWNTYHKTIGF